MENIMEYGHALVSLLVFVVIVLLQGALVGAGKAKAGLTPGSTPVTDYSNSLYRLNRSHQNGVEIMPAATAAIFACIVLGVSSWWVNVLMSAFLLLRIIFVAIYAWEVGKPTQGVRTLVYVAGWGCIVALCAMSIYTVFVVG